MYIAVTSRCLGDLPFLDACSLLTDYGYSRVECWFDEDGDHLKPSDVVADLEGFVNNFRASSRLTPVAFCFEQVVDLETFTEITRLAKLMRVVQITVPSTPLRTPFNAEIQRLQDLIQLANQMHFRPFNGQHAQVPALDAKGNLTREFLDWLEFAATGDR